MTDLKKQGQILLKRNGFWILLTFLLALLFTGIIQNNSLDSTHSTLIANANDLNLMGETGRKYSLDTRIDKKFFDENEKLYEELSEKYEVDKYKDFDYNEASEKEQKEFDEYNLKNGEYLSSLKSYKFTKEGLLFNRDMYMFDGLGIVLVLALAFLFTSMEHATSYYEFSKMYPWSRKKDFLMKVLIGSGIIFIFSILSSILSYMIISTSNFDILKIGLGFIPAILKNIIYLLVMFVIFMSTGILAGNVIGHFGLSVMFLFFLDLLDLIFANIKNIFTGGFEWEGGIYSIIDRIFPEGNRINTVIRTILRPINEFDRTNASRLGLLIFSIIVFFIALSLIDRLKTENSGIMIMIKPIEILAKVMITLLVASYGTLIFQNSVFDGFSIVNIFIFIILTYVFIKIFNILFKLKLKV
ncbi:hypothetical protein HV819_09755 [Anaerococcus sp. AGMB00486]|uniref:ABC transporter permease n=2 Tax=Anaerococcus TaxID=165779 RepID=A0ABX2NC66_9FIRM|nr:MULTISPECIES: hypothetical protein [Anaerococcus]MDY3006869.1 hypothetical protein [Anaerococcus porci]MSS77804.1 hypothetical protein [Anaerococcus porci]NVF12238.1 hypothetical protein [Anaerococcus faecalis]